MDKLYAEAMRRIMKIKRFIMPMLAVGLLWTTISIPPVLPSPLHSVTVFTGKVLDQSIEGDFLEFYINHEEQLTTIPIICNENRECTYTVTIPMENLSVIGSTVMFKKGDQVYGFGVLDGTKQILDLQPDVQGY